jgi:hypothetical protein
MLEFCPIPHEQDHNPPIQTHCWRKNGLSILLKDNFSKYKNRWSIFFWKPSPGRFAGFNRPTYFESLKRVQWLL